MTSPFGLQAQEANEETRRAKPKKADRGSDDEFNLAEHATAGVLMGGDPDGAAGILRVALESALFIKDTSQPPTRNSCPIFPDVTRGT